MVKKSLGKEDKKGMENTALQGDTLEPPPDLRAHRVRIGIGPCVLLSFRLDSAPQHPLGLTAAERRVALALLQGLSNAEIAGLRGSSPRTVANQIAGLYRKLGVQSRAELASRWAHALSPALE